MDGSSDDVYVCIYMYVYIYVFTDVSMYVRIHLSSYPHIPYACTYVFMPTERPSAPAGGGSKRDQATSVNPSMPKEPIDVLAELDKASEDHRGRDLQVSTSHLFMLLFSLPC